VYDADVNLLGFKMNAIKKMKAPIDASRKGDAQVKGKN
jgi:hypothetical protein